MFSIEQIAQAHSQVKTGGDFPAYIQAIKALGVEAYQINVEDGHAIYWGADGFQMSSEPLYEKIEIARDAKPELFLAGLKAHQRAETSYAEFITLCAASGITKWVVDTGAMTCTYYDQADSNILEEAIPEYRV